MQPELHNNYFLEGLETERLRFRKLSWDDFDAWQELFVSDDVAIFLGLDPKLSKKELTQKWFDKTFDRYENNLGSMNALIDKKTNRLVGQSGLLIQTVEGEKRMEVSYSILPEFWRKGYAYEAANACKNYAFENDLAENLISVIEPKNIGSEKVALKNGMTFEKRVEEYSGAPFNVFSIAKEDWLKARKMNDPYGHAIKTWKTLAKPYDEKFKHFDLYDETYAFFCSELRKENPTILEVGCGPGTVTKHLNSLLPTAEILATDVSSEMLEFAKANVPAADFQVLDAREINTIQRTFDGFLSGFLIPYLDEDVLSEFVESASNLLNDNRIIYLSFIEGNYAESNIQTPTNDVPMNVYLYQESDLLKLFAENAIQHLKSFRLPYPQPNGSMDYHLILIGKKIKVNS